MHLSSLIASNVLSKHFKQTADEDSYTKKYFAINTQHKLTDKIRDACPVMPMCFLFYLYESPWILTYTPNLGNTYL